MRISPLPLFFVFLISSITVNPVLCQQIDLSNVDTYLAEALNISVFASGILLTMIITSMFLFPFIFARSSKKITVAMLLIGFGFFCFAVAVGWLSVWVLLLTTLLVAGLYAGLWGKIIRG